MSASTAMIQQPLGPEADLFDLPGPRPQPSALLIVDDTPANIGVLRTLLKPRGHQIYAATSGQAALEIAERVPLDLILLDVCMPEMDGFETCRRLKASPHSRAVPVIFVSARTDSCDVVEGFSLGAADYIHKPVRVEEALARIDSQLQLRHHLRVQREQAERMQAIVNHMAEGLLLVDPALCIRKANPAAERLFGAGPMPLCGRSLRELLAAESVERLRTGRQELCALTLQGEPLHIELTLSPLPGQAELQIALLHDISQYKHSEQVLRRLAEIDELTQLANRRQFDRGLAQAWRTAAEAGQPLSLLLLDVDHFKQYNDRLGHRAGDECLQALGQLLQALAQRPEAPPGCLAARYGGEEFALILPGDAEQAQAWAESLRADLLARQLSHPASSAGPWVTVSIGSATLVPKPQNSQSELFQAADAAMYRAKAEGRNRLVQAETD
ncbi:diguanylate cyclase domain-containing protein [Kinneretia aquatilis]|nr:diguanylate cyclase [Paucibacter aquatile]